jgi:hypothetical protein
MGVWDMLYLIQKYKKALVHADNPAFSPETRAEFSAKAEQLRAQMARYLERVEAGKMRHADLVNQESSK